MTTSGLVLPHGVPPALAGRLADAEGVAEALAVKEAELARAKDSGAELRLSLVEARAGRDVALQEAAAQKQRLAASEAGAEAARLAAAAVKILLHTILHVRLDWTT